MQSCSAYSGLPNGVRAARKGAWRKLPGAETWSSEVRVFDGRLKLNPENSHHYCLLLGDGDIIDRGEDDEGPNSPVCRSRSNLRDSIVSRNRVCAKADYFYFYARFITPVLTSGGSHTVGFG